MGSKSGQSRRTARKNDSGPNRFFVTGDGVEVKIKPVSDVLQTAIRLGYAKEWRARGEPIDPPVYIAKTVAGEEVPLTLDADSLEIPNDSEATAENQEKWAAHIDALERLVNLTRQEVMKCLFTRGIIVEEHEGWEAEQARWHAEIPEDPIDRKLYYILTEVVTNPIDMQIATIALMRLSKAGSVSEEVLEAAIETFRSSSQEGQAEDSADEAPNSGGPLDAQPKPLGNAG